MIPIPKNIKRQKKVNFFTGETPTLTSSEGGSYYCLWKGLVTVSFILLWLKLLGLCYVSPIKRSPFIYWSTV